MIAHFEEGYCIDSTRIWAPGKSNGGGFVGGYLACDPSISTTIAAFAPVSGAFYVGPPGIICAPEHINITCNPRRGDVPVIAFHGSNDTTVAYAGGEQRTECLPTIPHWVREWSVREGYGLTNLTTALYDGNVTKVFGSFLSRRPQC